MFTIVFYCDATTVARPSFAQATEFKSIAPIFHNVFDSIRKPAIAAMLCLRHIAYALLYLDRIQEVARKTGFR